MSAQHNSVRFKRKQQRLEQKQELISIMEDAPLEVKLALDFDPTDEDQQINELLVLKKEMETRKELRNQYGLTNGNFEDRPVNLVASDDEEEEEEVKFVKQQPSSVPKFDIYNPAHRAGFMEPLRRGTSSSAAIELRKRLLKQKLKEAALK